MKQKFVYAGLVLCLALLQVVALPLRVRAAPQAAAAITVSPAQVILTVSKDAPEVRETLTITNAYDTPVRMVAEMFAIDESGVRLLPSGKISDEVAKALTISDQEVLVPAHGRATLTITAQNTKELTPGGHYVSLLLTEKAAVGSGSSFRSAVAVNVFFINADNVRRDIRLVTTQINNNIFRLPSSVKLTMSNGGNMHIIPRASVGLYNDEGTLLGSAVANSDSQLLFPGRKADFTARMTYFERVLWPQRITMRTMYRIDGTDVQLLQYKKIWYVPFVDVLLLLLVCTIGWVFRKHFKRSVYYRVWKLVGRVVKRIFVTVNSKFMRKSYVVLARQVHPKKATIILKTPAPPVAVTDPALKSAVGESDKASVSHRKVIKINVDEPAAKPIEPAEITKPTLGVPKITKTSPMTVVKSSANALSVDPTPAKARKPRTTAANKAVKKTRKNTPKKQSASKAKQSAHIRGKSGEKA